MKLYTTSEFISTDTSFKKNNLTTKMKLYTNSEYMSIDTSFAPKSIIILLYYNTPLLSSKIASFLLRLNT